MKKNMSFYLFISLSFFLFNGCENGREGFDLEEKIISFVTFNARLGDELPLLKERTESFYSILDEIDSEVICIQEIFDRKEVIKTKDFLEEKGYYSIFINTDNEDFKPIPPSCTEQDVAPIFLCVAMECGGMDPACILQNCLSYFFELPPDCQSCVLGQGLGAITGGDISSIISGCMTQKEIVYKNNGNNGIILASKFPLKDKGFIELPSYDKFRVALFATVGETKKENGEIVNYKPAIGDVRIVCTALTDLSNEPYDGLNGSWEQEQLAQINEILGIPVKENVVQTVIMGDFNSNISGGINLIENNPDPVNYLISDGFYDPYFDVLRDDEIDCTICPENPLVNPKTQESVPDHIFFKKKKGFVFDTQRVFLNKFILINEKEKTKTRYSISDHYGIKTTMSVK